MIRKLHAAACESASERVPTAASLSYFSWRKTSALVATLSRCVRSTQPRSKYTPRKSFVQEASYSPYDMSRVVITRPGRGRSRWGLPSLPSSGNTTRLSALPATSAILLWWWKLHSNGFVHASGAPAGAVSANREPISNAPLSGPIVVSSPACPAVRDSQQSTSSISKHFCADVLRIGSLHRRATNPSCLQDASERQLKSSSASAAAL